MTGKIITADSVLPESFYDRDAVIVARQLLGKHLVRRTREGLCRGLIVETEAYLHEGDSACHTFKGPNRKNQSMFGPPGRAYVYTIHARCCFNVVTQSAGQGAAVLIRAVEPVAGIELMRRRRNKENLPDLTRGPARLCEAFAIDRGLDSFDLTQGKQLWIAGDQSPEIADNQARRTTRIGVTSAHDLVLRFIIAGNPFVSGPKSLRM